MKRIISLVIILSIMAGVIPAFAGEGDYYKFYEAESGIKDSSYAEAKTASDASGGTYVNFKKSNTAVSIAFPVLSFSFNVSVSDYYYIWVRVKVPDTSHDSLYYALNNTSYKNTYALPLNGQNWYWHKLEYKKLAAGDYTFDVFPRELTYVDKVLITNMRYFIPNGINESFDDDLEQFISHQGPEFKPKAGHPRILFTSADIPRIKANLTAPENSKNKKEFDNDLKSTVTGLLSTTTSSANYNASTLETIESRAFNYIINNDEASGRSAISSIKNYVDTLYLDSSKYSGMYSYSGQVIYTLAKVYDWCYPLLTAEDKIKFHKMFICMALTTETGWPPESANGVAGHDTETQLMRDMLAAGIAMYDEYPYIYNNVAGKFFDEYVDYRKSFMYDARVHSEGEHYFAVRYSSEIMAALLLDAIDYPTVFGENQQYVPYWHLYARLPDGFLLRNGDSVLDIQSKSSTNPYFDMNYYAIFQAANYYNDPYLKTEALASSKMFSVDSAYINQSLSPVEFLIFNNPELEAKPLSELPLSMYFPAPYGGMIARTGWHPLGSTGWTSNKQSDEVVAEMKVSEFWFPSHSHHDSGSFQIYYKGALAIDSGLYATSGSGKATTGNTGNTYYNSDHYNNYYSRTVAHNCMLIADPNETVAGNLIADGGQEVTDLNVPANFSAVKNNYETKYRTSKVLARGTGEDTAAPEYTYLKGDLSYAYSDKVEGYERSFMFLNLLNEDTPAALIVFDRVESSDPSFKKTWLLHGKYEPEINGTRTVFKNDQNGYNGKMTVDTLLPSSDNADIVKIGGEGYDFFVRDVTGKTEGTNWIGDVSSKYYLAESKNGWRMELSPRNDAKEDYFLNVIQVADADETAEPLAVEKLETASHIGVKIDNRVVLFGKEKERIKEEVKFNLESDTDKKIVIADLSEGIWQISKDDNIIGIANVSEESGTLSFEGAGGNYSAKMITAVADTPKVLPVVPYSGNIDFYPIISSVNRKQYENIGEYAVMAFAKNINPGSYYELTDYGFVFSSVDFEPTIESSFSEVISSKNVSVDNTDKFGALIYGRGILPLKNYFVRPYAKYKKDNSTTVIYGDTTRYKASALNPIP